MDKYLFFYFVKLRCMWNVTCTNLKCMTWWIFTVPKTMEPHSDQEVKFFSSLEISWLLSIKAIIPSLKFFRKTGLDILGVLNLVSGDHLLCWPASSTAIQKKNPILRVGRHLPSFLYPQQVSGNILAPWQQCPALCVGGRKCYPLSRQWLAISLRPADPPIWSLRLRA